MVPIDVTLVVVVVEGSFLEECLRRGSPHPACFNGERNKGDMCGRNILPPLDSLLPRIQPRSVPRNQVVGAAAVRGQPVLFVASAVALLVPVGSKKARHRQQLLLVRVHHVLP